MAFADVITQVLFTRDFLLISTLVIFGMFGMLFRTVSFSMGYMILAKADTKLYTKTAIGFNVLYFALSIAGYHYRGLAGLGMAFALHYFLHFALLLLISNRRYQFSFDKEFALVFLACIAISSAALVFALYPESALRTIALLALMIVSALFSLYFIHKKVDLLSVVQNLKNRNHE
jgi:O-antigen/teichoic acid export membrane protein